MQTLKYLIISIGLMMLFSTCKKEIKPADFESSNSINTIDAGGDDYAIKIFPAPDGGNFLLGNTYISGKRFEVFFTKVNRKGFVEKTTLYGGSGDDIIYGAAMDEQGNMLAVGKTTSSELFIFDRNLFYEQYFLLYFDNAGNLKWQTAFTDTIAPYAKEGGGDQAYQAVSAGNGSFWVSGASRSYASYPPNPWGFNPTVTQATIFKIDKNKNVSNIKSYSLYYDDTTFTQTYPCALTKKANGNLLLVLNKQFESGNPNPLSNLRILELNQQGDSVGSWSGMLKQFINFNSNSIIEKSDGSYAYLFSPDKTFIRFSSGNLLQKTSNIDIKTLTNNSWMTGNAITTNNFIYFCGSETPQPVSYTDQGLLNVDNNIPLMIKTDWEGNILWTRKMELMNGIMNDVLINYDGGFTVFGTYKSNSVKTADLFIMKFNKDNVIVN